MKRGRPAIHFAPELDALSSGSGGNAPPMISATEMAGASALVREVFGDGVLRHANRATMLKIELIETTASFHGPHDNPSRRDRTGTRAGRTVNDQAAKIIG